MTRVSLPIDEKINEIQSAIQDKNQIIVVSPPGSGKTTRVPVSICELFTQKVALLQPRRVAVKSSAERIAFENNWTLGKEVGYQFRFEKELSDKTQLEVYTEGLFSRIIQTDPLLKKYDVVILDEFHERSIHIDFVLSWIINLQKTKRPDLKLVIMSATIDSNELLSFLDNAQLIETKGKSYPLDIHYKDMPPSFGQMGKFLEKFAHYIAEVSEKHINGDILVFLPGVGEINKVQGHLNQYELPYEILQLHGNLSSDEQSQVIKSKEYRKIILSTNVAETSLTVEGVSVVIDSGLAKVMTFEPSVGIQNLELRRITMANANQRAGRAARTQKGSCYRFWTQSEEKRMDAYLKPEIKRVDISDYHFLFYAMKELSYANSLSWYEDPELSSIEYCEQSLSLMGLIKEQKLTEFGKYINSISLPIKQATLLAHCFNQDHYLDGAIACAILEDKDFLVSVDEDDEFDSSDCDVSLRVSKYKERKQYSKREFKYEVIDRITRAKKQYLELKTIFKKFPYNYYGKEGELLSESLLLTYPERMAIRREKQKHKGRMLSGRGVLLANQSCVKRGNYFLCLSVVNTSSRHKGEGTVYFASKFEPSWVKKHFETYLELKTYEVPNKKDGPKIFEAISLLSLPLEPLRPKSLSVDELKNKFLNEFDENAMVFFNSFSNISDFLLRLEILKNYCKNLDLPSLEENLDEIKEALELLFEDKPNPDLWTEEDVLTCIEFVIDPSIFDFVDKEMPTEIKLPSGKMRSIIYEKGSIPKISVYLQALLGIDFAPTIAMGNCKLNIELLAPNQRPIQLTNNLKSFWKGSYQSIRKELKGRYPKHSWPEDPCSK